VFWLLKISTPRAEIEVIGVGLAAALVGPGYRQIRTDLVLPYATIRADCGPAGER
jgi:hypothetical protein